MNTVTNQTYIGSSVNVPQRFRDHLKALCKGNHKNPHLQSSWNKYGENAFVMEHLIDCNDGDLAEIEQRFIDAYYSHDMPLYNVKPANESRAGFSLPEQTRLKMSLANIGQKRSSQTCENISKALTGRKLSPEHRAKVIAAKIGKPLSSAHRAALSRAAMGKIISETQRIKISIANTGKKQSPESIAKRAASNTGKIRSPECRARISAAHVTTILTDESRLKLRLARLGTTLSMDTRRKISAGLIAAYKRKPRMPRSQESRMKISLALKGKPWTQKRRAAQRSHYAIT